MESLAKKMQYIGPLTDHNITEHEEEIQVIDLDPDSDNKNPFLLLFPKLKQEGVNIENLTQNMSTTDVTKLLIGQKAVFTDLSFSRSLRRKAIDLTTLIEEEFENSSDETIDLEKHAKPLEKHERPRLDSADADVSDEDDEDEDDDNEYQRE